MMYVHDAANQEPEMTERLSPKARCLGKRWNAGAGGEADSTLRPVVGKLMTQVLVSSQWVSWVAFASLWAMSRNCADFLAGEVPRLFDMVGSSRNSDATGDSSQLGGSYFSFQILIITKMKTSAHSHASPLFVRVANETSKILVRSTTSWFPCLMGGGGPATSLWTTEATQREP